MRTVRLRVPAESAADGEAFARAALEAAAARLPAAGPPRELGRLTLTVPAGAGADPERLGGRLAEGLR